MSSLRRNNSEVQEKASFKKISDNLRRLTPLEIQCHVFCGGKRCKYEGSNSWTKNQMALDGIFSHWVTCNILAMARPNVDVIENFDLIGQFNKKGIRTLINLQQPGEHAHCGKSLDSSGFSYSPDSFMKNGIFFYNFGWKDYQVGHLDAITDIVKVMAFSLQEGKIAVHCHAGLGRTGVLIACFLIYWCRISANQAIQYVRLKRPSSIQSEAQVECVRNFAQHILPNFTVFPKEGLVEFTLPEFLHRQETVLHGEDARTFKYLPKVVFQLCERLLRISGCNPVASVEEDSAQNTGARRRAFWHRFLSLQPGLSPATTPTEKETLTFFPKDSLSIGTNTTTAVQLSDTSEEEANIQVLQPIDKCHVVEGSGSNMAAGIKNDSCFNNVTTNGSSVTQNLKPEESSSSVALTQSPLHSDTDSSVPSVNAPEIVLPKSNDSEEDMSIPPSAFLANRRRSVSATDLTNFMGNGVSPLLLEEPPGSPYVRMRAPTCATEGPNDSVLVMVVEEVPALKVEELFHQTKPHPVRQVLEVKRGKGTFTIEEVAKAILATDADDSTTIQTQQMVTELQAKVDLTPDGMDIIPEIDNIVVLARLLHVWLQKLKQPVLSKQEVTRLMPCPDDPVGALHKLDKGTRVTVEYILRFVAHLIPIEANLKSRLLTSLLRSLTHLPHMAKEDENKHKSKAPTSRAVNQTPSKVGHLETAVNFSQKLLPLLTNQLPI